MTKFTVGQKVITNARFIPSTEVGMETYITEIDPDGTYNIADTKRPGTSDWFAYEHELDAVVEPVKVSKPKDPNTKIAKLKAHFLSGRSLTQLEAIGLYGAFRLAARVHDLKADGMKIVTRMKEDPNGNPYAEYQLRSPWVKG